MAAAQQLPSSLRAALTYSLGVLALRRPILHKILDYEDECFALLMLVLESHSLRTNDASFSETLYGLKRRTVNVNIKLKNLPRAKPEDSIQYSGLKKSQKILSVVFLVVLPYFKSKLNTLYAREREAQLQASLWGDEIHVPRPLEGQSSLLASKFQKAVYLLYPWIHATVEGLSFSFQLLYLLDATGFYSVGLKALGIHVCRATGQELMDTSSRVSKIRSRERERLRGPPWLKKLQAAILRSVYVVLDYSQTGLIAAVFFFKMMEWWYQTAEERMSAPVVYPPPPPPPPPKVAKEGIKLPKDRTLCPLCSQKRANPSVLTVSGFVFCYTCAFKYVSQYNRCPVTLIPASSDQIRRLFHDM